MEIAAEQSNDELLRLIEELTTTGKPKLDEIKCKKFKNLCKLSDENVRRSFYFIWSQLEKNHSEIRRSAVQLTDILFSRSALFRDLLLDNIQAFVELTLGINHKKPLPLPYPSAKDLKLQTVSCLKNWHNVFGKGYKKLDLAVTYLCNCKNINFNANVNNDVEPEGAHLAVIRHTRINVASNGVNELRPEINSCIVEIEACFNLLLPSPEQFDIYHRNSNSLELEKNKNIINSNNLNNNNNDINIDNNNEIVNIDNNNEIENGVNEFRRHGLTSENFSLNVCFPADSKIFLRKTEDNADILTSFYEKVMLLKHKYLNILKNYLKVLTKHGAASNIIKPVLDLKMSIDKVLNKADRIVVKNDLTTNSDEGSDEESNFDDFIDVPGLADSEESTSSSSYPGLQSEKHKWKIMDMHKDIEDDPTHAAATLKKLQTVDIPTVCQQTSREQNLMSEEPSQSSSEDNLKQKAPVVPYGIDLYHWGEAHKEVPLKPLTSDINWWITSDENEQVDKEALASMKERVINFTGSFEPVKWKCRAPMSNGKLCFRMDRKKCPFHGLIIPRDKMGRPNGPNDAGSSSAPSDKQDLKMKEQACNNGWKDPELEADISAAIGIDITFHPNNKRKKKKNLGLTDLKSLKNNTPYKRLEKKVFNKAAIRRVANTLDKIDAKRIRDKFGNNFNYAHTK